MEKRIFGRRLLGYALTAAMVASLFTGTAFGADDFAARLTEAYTDPGRAYQSDVRWWMAEASLTDEEILQEIQEMYDAGFHGVELCMQGDNNADDATYAYGSAMWAHKWKLMMNTFLDHGMNVSLTSGTNWSTSNVPGLDPDSQQASQVIAMGSTVVGAGESITELPKPGTMRESGKGQFLGAYAYELVSQSEKSVTNWGQTTVYPMYTVNGDSMIDLGAQCEITQGETIYDQAIDWTNPNEKQENAGGRGGNAGAYVVFAYWTHGNYVTASPAAETCYATNYFDQRGVEALRTFWEANYLDDEELNQKIKEGDVQLFMDSLEINPTGGITWWTEDIRQEFLERKGYDILPYIFLVDGLPQVQAVANPYYPPAEGNHELSGNTGLREKIINDWVDILTQLYEENMLLPLKEWLNSVGIKTRAQISYGRSFEITEPSVYVDYPEAENFNQYDNADILRLHTAGAKLQNKTLSTETGASLSTYTSTVQDRLKQIYAQYAVGFSRVIWHIWSATMSYGETGAWPGWGNSFDRWDNREPAYADFDEFNAHIGRVQKLLRTGKSRTDIGIIHNNWNQGIRFGGGLGQDINGMNYMLAHMGVYYRSTQLQDNGYTYDYLSPDLLSAEGVYFDEETKTVELAGYKALMLYQNWLDVSGAEKILDWAKKGLKVIIMRGAAERTPFNDGQDERLAAIMEELKGLDTVREVEIYDAPEEFDYFSDALIAGYKDGALEALQELGVTPYAGYAQPNHQLLGQSRQDEEGNRYLYLYNYCPDDYHKYSYLEEVRTESHGTHISTEGVLDGLYIPYQIDPWSGKVTQLGNYRQEEGRTYFPISLDYGSVALYAFAPAEAEGLHVVETNAQKVEVKDGQLIATALGGELSVALSDGRTLTRTVDLPQAWDITGWTLKAESWTPGEAYLTSTETIGDVTTVNSVLETKKEEISVTLDTLKTWDQIEEIGPDVSGQGVYEATFTWDASAADGAYLDFGSLNSTMEVWINGVKVGGQVSTSPDKAKAAIAMGAEGKDQYTGGISFTRPCVDIGEYLVDGENTIRLSYSSSIGNAALTVGAARGRASGWWGISSVRKPCGPEKAVLIPYALEVLE